MVTRRGIYYDLDKSVYRYTTPDNLTFVFSSDLHLTKFEEQFKEHRAELNMKLKARYGIEFDLSMLADAVLYKKIENRGFLIISERGCKLTIDSIIFRDGKLMQYKR